MPIEKVPGGWRYGKSGKVYKNKQDAIKQGRAIEISRHQGEPGVPKAKPTKKKKK